MTGTLPSTLNVSASSFLPGGRIFSISAFPSADPSILVRPPPQPPLLSLPPVLPNALREGSGFTPSEKERDESVDAQTSKDTELEFKKGDGGGVEEVAGKELEWLSPGLGGGREQGATATAWGVDDVLNRGRGKSVTVGVTAEQKESQLLIYQPPLTAGMPNISH